jgi:hypothetical protein
MADSNRDEALACRTEAGEPLAADHDGRAYRTA